MLHVYVTTNAGSKWTFIAPPHFEIARFFSTVPVLIFSTLQGKGVKGLLMVEVDGEFATRIGNDWRKAESESVQFNTG